MTLEGTETNEVSENGREYAGTYSRKTPAAIPSRPEASNKYKWYKVPGVVDVRAEKWRELVLLLSDAVFYGERLPGEARECGILVGIISTAAALMRSPTHPPGGPGAHLVAAGAYYGR